MFTAVASRKMSGALALVVYLLLGATAHAEPACPRGSETISPAPPIKRGKVAMGERLAAQPPKSADLVIIGDSIAQHWSANFLPSLFSSKKVLNLGVGGDRTQNVLFRLESYPTNLLNPSLVFLVIGTNNVGARYAPCAITMGIIEVVDTLQVKWPSAAVYVLQILPRGADFHFREKVRNRVNESLSRASGRHGFHLVSINERDITCGWQNGCGNYRPDQLHPVRGGYEIIGDAFAKAVVDNR